MYPAIAVTLPGGALVDDRLQREAAFHPLTGRLEAQIADVVDTTDGPRPARVSALLGSVLAHIGGQPATPKRVASLGFTDRQFLMLAFALEHRDDEQWRHVACAHCGAWYDIGFRLSGLPISPAGEGYPRTALAVGGRRLRVRVPTGEDEGRIAGLSAPAARRTLALACVEAVDDAPPAQSDLDALGETGIDAIDAALDALAPQIATTLSAACNECGGANALELDPYQLAMPDRRQVYLEVHALALRYHWSEDEILQLPRARRRLYLDLIDESAGHAH